tara:strand:+ start:1365 stop:1655 length:291 start_codon:yes stop_codon:yes gene_type:complete
MDFSTLFKVNLDPEGELSLEVAKRKILNNPNHKEVAKICATLLYENKLKDSLIANCIEQIGELESHLIKIELEKNRPFWKRLFKKAYRPYQQELSD